jgi:Tol biopolymer transport system component
MKISYIAVFVIGLFMSSTFALEGMALQTQDNNFRGGKLIVHYLSSGKRNVLFEGHACGPAFSAEGRRISFIDVVKKKVMTCNIDGSNLKEAGDSKGYGELGVTYWLPDDYIYFNYHNNVIFRIKSTGSTAEEFFKSGKQIDQFGISNDGKRIAWTQPKYRVMVYDFETKKERTTGDDCQGTMSPDGKYFTQNMGGHKVFQLHKFEDMSVWKTLKVPGGSKHNLHRWSHYCQDYVVYTKEGKHQGVIHNIQTDQTTPAGVGTIWDFYDKEFTNATHALANKKDIKLNTNGIIVSQSLSSGGLKVYLPSDERVNIEILRLNGTRVLNTSIKGAGLHYLPVSCAKPGILIIRINNDKRITIKRVSVR